jgi:hypothetical protein
VLESVERFFANQTAAVDHLGATREDQAHDTSKPVCCEASRGA